MEEFIRPLVEDRLTKMEELGEAWDDAPVRWHVSSIRIIIIHFIGAQNDMLMWLMSEARGVERSLEGLARRLLQINVASVNLMSLYVASITVTALLAAFDSLLTGTILSHDAGGSAGVVLPPCSP
jgi:hypothetical protein